MATRRTKIATAATVAVLATGGYFIYALFAAQGQGVLAQAPLNTQVQVPPAFIMAIDDSGSMTYHNQFPGADGKACWSKDTSSSAWSFFVTSGVNAGRLRTGTTSGGACGWAFSYGSSPRNGENNSWRGIPPVDTMGFARSPDYNPAYFDPTVTYQPWLNSDGTSFGNASLTATRIDPRPNGVGLGTVNLTAWHDGTAVAGGNGQLSDRFNTYNGMVLPAGTEYRTENTNGCGGLTGTTWSWPAGWTSWHTLSSDHTMGAQCNVFIKHRLATFYLKSDARPAGYESVPRTQVDDACGPGCDMWRYDIRATDTVALQNFANWFSYYGNRHRALVGGLTRSLVDIENMRIGYFRINQHGSFDNPNLTTADTNTERVQMLDMSDGTDKASLYDLIVGNPSWGSTYNRQSVYAGGRQFMRKDPITSSRGGAPVQRACQKNALMLFTDGYSNSDGPTVGNVDGTMGVPFQDGHSDTMADIATSFYKNDAGGTSPLDTNFPEGQVPLPSSCPTTDPKVNCQANLHVNFYGVTLGGRGNLFNPDVDADAYTTPAIYENWPSRQNDNRSTIDDIWHAATNTHGELVNARTPADILAAMRRILSSVTAGSSPSGTIALTGARIASGSLAVAPRYEVGNNGTDWFSELTAQKVVLHPTTRVPEFQFAWEASDEFPTPSARDIYYGDGNTARPFDGGSGNVTLAKLCSNTLKRCTPAEITALGVDLAQSISYLRGNRTLEKKNGGELRDRTTALGDIVNSTPVVSSPLDDYGYGSLPGAIGTSYRTFLTAKRASQRYMVYVGANDGMFHAFDGGMGADGVMDTAGGREEFAYIPETSLGHMGNLLFPYDPDNDNDQKFDHRYYVDGPLAVSDVRIGGTWKTIVVGTSGAGGRSVFALDVSDPDSFSANDRMWEINNFNTSLDAEVRSNIGHVLGKPVIVPVKTTQNENVTWMALFGNGYNSASGKAVLFAVEIGNGSNPTIHMIEAVETGANVPAGSNGLGNIVAVDRWGGPSAGGITGQFRDGLVDTVYGADQRGAVWKFDLRTPVPNAGLTINTPLFTTRTHTENSNTYRQPILGGLTAATGANGGVMLYFGTGSFSFVNDPGEDEVQSLYAVNDELRAQPTSTTTRATLQGYTVTTTGTTRTMTAGTAPLAARGWFVDLPAGERFVGYPRIATGLVFMPTYAPQSGSTGCSTQGFNWLFGLNTRTGAAGLSSVRFGSPTGSQPAAGTAAVALETGGTAPVKDVAVMAIPRANPPGGPDPTAPPGTPPPEPPAQGCWMLVTVSGAQPMYLPYPCGRQSWRQLQ